MPVFSSHLLDCQELGVGSKIREMRSAKGFNLRDLAGRIGVSAAKLSNIEHGKVSLDLAELAEIARVLEAPLPAFCPPDTVRHYFVWRRENLSKESPIFRPLMGPEPGPSVHHNSVWPLADPFVGKHMEPLRAQIRPLADEDLHFIAHDHEEFMFVLRGEVETLLGINDRVVAERLLPGDGIYFCSNLPHCHRSATDQFAETINVIYSLRGAIDPADSELSTAGRPYYRRAVYGNPVREAAAKIALLRRSRGLTLAQLARGVGVGVRRMVEIENGRKAPDIDLLVRLARQFRRPVEYFFAASLDHQPSYYLQRGTDIPRLPVRQRRPSFDGHGRSNTIFRLLAEGFLDRGVHPCYVQVKTIDGAMSGPYEHPGQEFIYVLDGELELLTQVENDSVTESLRAGDSVFLESSIPHSIRSSSHNPLAEADAEGIVVFWSPLGEASLFD